MFFFQDEGSDESIDVYDSATGTTGKDPSFVIIHQQQRIDVLEADDVTLSSMFYSSACTPFLVIIGSNTIHKPGSGNFDLTSESAVKISGDLGELFDDSEEEDDLQKIVSFHHDLVLCITLLLCLDIIWRRIESFFLSIN